MPNSSGSKKKRSKRRRHESRQSQQSNPSPSTADRRPKEPRRELDINTETFPLIDEESQGEASEVEEMEDDATSAKEEDPQKYPLNLLPWKWIR